MDNLNKPPPAMSSPPPTTTLSKAELRKALEDHHSLQLSKHLECGAVYQGKIYVPVEHVETPELTVEEIEELRTCVDVAAQAYLEFTTLLQSGKKEVMSTTILSKFLKKHKPRITSECSFLACSDNPPRKKDVAGDKGRRFVSDLFLGMVVWGEQVDFVCKQALSGFSFSSPICMTRFKLMVFAMLHSQIAPLPHLPRSDLFENSEFLSGKDGEVFYQYDFHAQDQPGLVAIRKLYAQIFSPTKESELDFRTFIDKVSRQENPLSNLNQNKTNPADLLARIFSVPSFLTREIYQKHGQQKLLQLLQASNSPGPTTLRVNTLKGTKAEVLESLANDGYQATPIESCETAILLTPPKPVSKNQKPRGSPLTGHGAWQLSAWKEGKVGDGILTFGY